MAPTTTWQCNAILKQWGTTAADRVDYATDTIKLALITDVTTPLQDTHDYWDDLDQDEIAAGSGYTAGGATLGTKTLTLDTGTNTVKFDCADPSWTFTASKTFRWGVIYKDTGTPSTSVILGIINLETNQTTSTVFTIQVSADGLLEAVIS